MVEWGEGGLVLEHNSNSHNPDPHNPDVHNPESHNPDANLPIVCQSNVAHGTWSYDVYRTRSNL